MYSRWHLPMIFGVSISLFSAANVVAQDAQLPTVTAAKPVVRDVIDSDEFIGRFEAVDEVSVRARVGGYLDEVNFTDGALVKKGDKLFVIDQRPYRTALSQAEATLESTRSSLAFAETQFKRTESLTGTGTLSVSTLDDHRRELLSAQAAVRGAEAAAERAKLDLDYTTIIAPLTGRVDRRLISTGNLVQADQTVLTTIVSLDPIDFYFDVDERRLLSYARVARERGSALQEGGGALDVMVTIADSNEAPFKGKLDFAENRLDQASGTMRVRARFDNPNYVLQPGLFGRAELEGSNTYKAVLIPDEAIGADQNERIVYEVREDGTVATKPVRLGPKLHGYRVIRSGMTGDETIVVNGLMRARPGTKVKPEIVELPPEAQAAGSAQ
ncbi:MULTISPECIES: efflux RND transporter periplasmic adaptor subunit [Ensifer]|jgi:membrane fusion protein, multidrug efflux system|uniref:efflux RND transporter periplasmic adaptor subunit n=1 Tax=Ensifer TaxID=106591 RepID=UPI00070BCE92|nr:MULTISPECIES: efflux RND transporter periplasmic adaptor subunit [Ensifer]MDP9631233.1 RND family efflux transporter MFP subunit [Ensifer adhaerens]KQU95431.1 hemolysin secretion protein D [Ensifer sp. Root31]KQW59988.1 hemolysin secretion protein D [Ensifer sp. Root127]MBD9489747.1 efflux RND transporter periplasmic adaptor subunit [Ensifer sp. ENS11]NOV18990.1 efflux RND transporter periplasmic adaptor subunit [Ensifer canadensis]